LSAYRFCRTDDIALLVDAWNRCGLPHEPGAAPLTVASFKREIRELDLWCSSCMVAFDGGEPIAVLIGCKRPPHTLVLRVAVHPDHLRRGHGRHLLTSLSAKLAILGPPTLLAEVPAANLPARALFAACGWREARSYVDLVSTAPPASPAPAGLVVAATVGELADVALPGEDAPYAWERTRKTILSRGDRLEALAVASGETIDASAVCERLEGGGAAIWSLAAAAGPTGDAALGTLLRDLAHRVPGPIAIPRVSDEEIPFVRLRPLGFSRAAETTAFMTSARAA
jgi:GNAT superfamily N-acetyltransferase